MFTFLELVGFICISLILFISMCYGISYLWIYRREIRRNYKKTKRNIKKRLSVHEPTVCPDWADKELFEATRLKCEE